MRIIRLTNRRESLKNPNTTRSRKRVLIAMHKQMLLLLRGEIFQGNNLGKEIDIKTFMGHKVAGEYVTINPRQRALFNSFYSSSRFLEEFSSFYSTPPGSYLRSVYGVSLLSYI